LRLGYVARAIFVISHDVFLTIMTRKGLLFFIAIDPDFARFGHLNFVQATFRPCFFHRTARLITRSDDG